MPLTQESPAAYEALIEFLYRAPIGLLQTTLDGAITMINPMSAQLLMPLVQGGDLLNLFDVLEPVLPQLRGLAAGPSEPGSFVCEDLRVPLPRQPERDAPATTLALSLLRLDETTFLASISDVTMALQQEQQRLAVGLRHAKRTDSLTSMPNRTAVLERIEAALERARSDAGFGFAVLFINGDRFSRINVTLGQAAGDELLQLMAARMNGSVRQRDAGPRQAEPLATAARLGGDEFVVLVEGLRSSDDVAGVSQRLVDALARPYAIGGQAVHAPASIGVVTASNAAATADSVLQDASLAMRAAKRAGGACWCLFAAPMRELARQRGGIEDGLRVALAEGQLFVVYQPIVWLHRGPAPAGAATGGACTAGVEALVRWNHPQRGLVPPIEFIEIAEETGLIGPLGEFVLNEACRQFVVWQQTLGERAPQVLSVNLSRAQLAGPSMADQVRRALDASGLAARHLQLEVTESLAAQDLQIQARLQELKLLGLTLALDDFGTGYSSLASLHLLPVDVVKIDRSFVSQAEHSAHHRVLIEATVRVARSLGMQTVAEGVETQGQADVLAALHCDKGQGYLYARPLTAAAATQWLTAQHRPAPDGAPALPAGPRETALAPAPESGPGPSPSPLGAAADGAAPPSIGSASTAVPLQAKLLELMGDTTAAVALFDADERVVWANHTFLALHWSGLDGLPTWEQMMRQAHARRRGVLIDTEDIDAWLAAVRLRYRRQPRRVFDSDMADGRWMRVVEETAPDGWQLSVSTDVTTLKVHEAQLRRAHDAAYAASITDPLTGMPNRRRVFARLGELLGASQSAPAPTPLAVVIVDLDEFKRINDTQGHAGGDRVLRAFSSRLAARVRQTDAVGRIGGEEFMLVLPDTDGHGARRLLGDLRSALCADALLSQPPGVAVGFSAGIAEAGPADTVELLWQRADAALYEAKQAGRGRDRFKARPVISAASGGGGDGRGDGAAPSIVSTCCRAENDIEIPALAAAGQAAGRVCSSRLRPSDSATSMPSTPADMMPPA